MLYFGHEERVIGTWNIRIMAVTYHSIRKERKCTAVSIHLIFCAVIRKVTLKSTLGPKTKDGQLPKSSTGLLA